MFTNIIKQSHRTMVILKTVYKNLIFIESLLLYIAEGQSGGVGQAGTSTSFDAGEQSIKSYYFRQTAKVTLGSLFILFIKVLSRN